jgi:hypothetical protein
MNHTEAQSRREKFSREDVKTMRVEKMVGARKRADIYFEADLISQDRQELRASVSLCENFCPPRLRAI